MDAERSSSRAKAVSAVRRADPIPWNSERARVEDSNLIQHIKI